MLNAFFNKHKKTKNLSFYFLFLQTTTFQNQAKTKLQMGFLQNPQISSPTSKTTLFPLIKFAYHRVLAVRNCSFNRTLQLFHGRRIRIRTNTNPKHPRRIRRRSNRRGAARNVVPPPWASQIPGKRMQVPRIFLLHSSPHTNSKHGIGRHHCFLLWRQFLTKRLHFLHILLKDFSSR